MLAYLGRPPGPLGPRGVAAHIGPRRSFLRRLAKTAAKAAQQGPQAVRELAPRLLGWIADHRNLRAAYDHLAAHGGQAAGPDGVTYGDLSENGVWSLVRALSRQIKAGSYRPGPVRVVDVPKGPGRGTRPITLENVADRVVGRAVIQVLEPLLDPGFDEHSFARSKRAHLSALATADALVRSQQRLLWVAEDIRDAFGSVPLGRLVQVLRPRIPSEDVVDLVGRIIEQPTGKGLRQGSPLSPLMMNLYLDHFLDRPWRCRHPEVPLLRYVDDVLILCRCEDNGPARYAELRKTILDAGLTLKGNAKSAIVDMALGYRATWLGWQISGTPAGIKCRLGIDDGSSALRDQLRDRFLELHVEPDAPLRAAQVVNGLIDAAGPCYTHEDHLAVYQLISEAANDAAFEELPSFSAFCERWRAAHARWTRLLQATFDRLANNHALAQLDGKDRATEVAASPASIDGSAPF